MRTDTIAFIVAGLAYVTWKRDHARFLKNAMSLPALPHSYYSQGNANATCSLIKSPAEAAEKLKFCEDVLVWKGPSAGESKLLMSCDPGRHEWNTILGPLDNPDPRGALWVYDEKATPSVKQLTLAGFPSTSDFHPLGIDLVESKGKPTTLFVINHRRDQTTIEVFNIDFKTPNTAQHIRTLANPAFVSPNALAPISPTSFYVTNDHYFTLRIPGIAGKIVPLVETLLSLPITWVDRVDFVGDKITITRAINYIPSANGITLSTDGKILAVTSTTSCSVTLYSRNPATNTVSKHAYVPLPFMPDNVSFDNGEFIVAGHPHFPSLGGLAGAGTAEKAGSLTAPSWVVGVSARTLTSTQKSTEAGFLDGSSRAPAHANYEVRNLYQSDGKHYSSSSAGVRSGKDLFVTGLYGNGVLKCTSK